MLITPRTTRAVRGIAAVAALAAGAAALVAGSPAANADPKWPTALVGHGSDTTQDVVGALAGEESGRFYTPVTSSVASGAKVLNSWDATGSACVTPRAPGATIQRGNGSTNGRRILSRAIDGGTWGSEAACAGKLTSGLVDFARSSSGPSGSGSDLTYIPFARDALSFGYVDVPGRTEVTTLTSAELTQIFTTAGGITKGGLQIIGCGIQTGSGTYGSWNSSLGMSAGQEATGTATCNGLGTGVRIQENDGAALKAKQDAAGAATQVIVGFSASNYISQNNGVVATQLPAPAGTVQLGAIDSLGLPYSGTPGSPMSPVEAFYTNGTYGRDVYNVVPTAKLGGLASSNADLKTMFVGPSSAVCQATTIIQTFGFLVPSNCGSTTLVGPLVA